LQSGNFDAAGEFFRRAAQEDSKDPRVHYYSALLMNRQTSIGDRSKLQETVRELETAISLDPNFADAYSLLGFAQARSGEPQKGLTNMQKAISLSPRNEIYRFNLAQMYLANRQPDQAIAILDGLSRSSNPTVSANASQSLGEAREFKRLLESGRTVLPADLAGDAPSVTSPRLEKRASPDDPLTTRPSEGAVQFVKGKITRVDCSSEPAATITVASGAKTLLLRITDTGHVPVIGADAFSCSWSNLNVAINYHENGTGGGTVISVEIQ